MAEPLHMLTTQEPVAITDQMAPEAQAPIVATHPMTWDGSKWNRLLGTAEAYNAIDPVSRTGAVSAEFKNRGSKGILAAFHVTANTLPVSLLARIMAAVTPTAGAPFNLTSLELPAGYTGAFHVMVYPGIDVVNAATISTAGGLVRAASMALPQYLSLNLTPLGDGGGGSYTAAAHYCLMP